MSCLEKLSISKFSLKYGDPAEIPKRLSFSKQTNVLLTRICIILLRKARPMSYFRRIVDDDAWSQILLHEKKMCVQIEFLIRKTGHEHQLNISKMTAVRFCNYRLNRDGCLIHSMLYMIIQACAFNVF